MASISSRPICVNVNPYTQCAAVMTQFSWTMLPPQVKKMLPFDVLYCKVTIQGQVFAWASTPPMIRVKEGRCPHVTAARYDIIKKSLFKVIWTTNNASHTGGKNTHSFKHFLLKLEKSMKTRSMSWLLMPRRPASPGHQHPITLMCFEGGFYFHAPSRWKVIHITQLFIFPSVSELKSIKVCLLFSVLMGLKFCLSFFFADGHQDLPNRLLGLRQLRRQNAHMHRTIRPSQHSTYQ